MVKNPSHQDSNSSTYMKKFKSFKLLEPSLGILGFLLITIGVVFGFFYLDYKSVVTGGVFRFRNDNGITKNRKRFDFLSVDRDGCDVFDGDWLWDEKYPLYESKDCRFLDEGFRCSENGRPDLLYTKWRWQPKDCNLPRGCYFQEGAQVKMEMKVETAYKKAIETIISWINSEINKTKTLVFFRTYAPVHFRGGNWRAGGNCHKETLPNLGSSPLQQSSSNWPQYYIFKNVISNRSKNISIDDATKVLNILNTTIMSSRRKDGHPSLYYLGPKLSPAAKHRQDCSHWCLPGVPDAWNEILYAFILKLTIISVTNNSSIFH